VSEGAWVSRSYHIDTLRYIIDEACPDRRGVYWDPDNPLDPALFRHESHPGDFELESLELEDVLITVHQPNGFRPYTASIFRAEIRQFRKRWLFYDFLCAENIVGQFDNCLFSLHKPQSIGRTTEKDLKDGDWARMVCLFPFLKEYD
jgi:distribution and morphology protein 31